MDGIPDIDFVRLEAGTFRMGSTPEQLSLVTELWEEADARLMADELPAKLVEIARSFEISSKEITQREYETVVGVQPSRHLGEDLPVHNVLHSEAVQFCARLSALTGVVHRLPTEAEWEYACRAGNDGLWCFGDDVERLIDFAWFEENTLGIEKVGRKRPNAWGLFDMHGNVWEWCSGNYAAQPGAYVVRGGSAFDGGFLTRSAERDYGPDYRKVNIGFRIVRELP
jgi:formylglycine-generating enzyme required for sulfatase activity